MLLCLLESPKTLTELLSDTVDKAKELEVVGQNVSFPGRPVG